MAAPSSKERETLRWRARSTRGTSERKIPRLESESANGAGASGRVAKRGPVEVFAQVHERQKGAQDAGLNFVREVQTAGGHARQGFSLFGNIADDFELAGMRRVAQNGLAAHPGAGRFDREREVQNAELLPIQCRGHFNLAAGRCADGHNRLSRIWNS